MLRGLPFRSDLARSQIMDGGDALMRGLGFPRA